MSYLDPITNLDLNVLNASLHKFSKFYVHCDVKSAYLHTSRYPSQKKKARRRCSNSFQIM